MDHVIYFPIIKLAFIRREVSLQSHDTKATEATDDFFLPKSIVAVAVAESYVDTVWFIKITNDIDIASDLIWDSYKNCVLAGQHDLKGHFLERMDTFTK